ncbi:hypothetical protein [Halorientalis salina]|uniref:hypothetical protein n=1 Tax=Halorientalis salina TaxID=2932266 RepID=UPI0010AB86DD|nr:hypothetical protein [Halorientalis salina]
MEATISDTRLNQVSEPDLVLSFIPGPLLVAVVVGFLVGVPLSLALAAGSLPASAAMGYALFYAPPIDGEERAGETQP